MTTQREKDLAEAASTYDHWDDAYPEIQAAFADGAEHARKEVALRLSRLMDASEQCGFGSDYKSHLKYYEETLSYLVGDLYGGPIPDEEAP